MVCPNDAHIRQQLEVTYQRSRSIPFHQQLLGFFRQIGTALVSEVGRDRRKEPRISRYYTIEGQLIWHVYDPATHESLTTFSELTVRDWLEHRYLD